MFVLDSSVSASWIFPDEGNEYTEAILDRLQTTDAVVPGIWPFEMANILVTGERRDRLTLAQSTRAIQLLSDLPIRVVEIDPLGSPLTVARDHGLSSYDASYVALALQRGIPLATQDIQLRRAGEQQGVGLLT